mgnify:CR=1 FL=1
MKIIPINTGNFKLDGGAMFGVVPKQLWQKTNPADEKNLCSWAMRSLLIEDGNRLMLIDTGIGNKQSEKFFSHYHLHGDDSLDKNLKALGYHRDDITDVFLTHLHFDHVGGAIERNADGNFRPAFKNAHFWSNADHWKWATEPNAREKASFLSENILPIQESGQLKFLKPGESPMEGMDLLWVNGHTEAQMIPHIQYQGKTLVFMADLLPSTGHIPLPYVMGYDTRPLLTLDEKASFLKTAAEKEYVLVLEHDNYSECCTVHEVDGRIKLKEKFQFKDIFTG